jgi:hypothetical protein
VANASFQNDDFLLRWLRRAAMVRLQGMSKREAQLDWLSQSTAELDLDVLAEVFKCVVQVGLCLALLDLQSAALT